MKKHSRLRTAIKRSVHFVLTDAFADSLVGVSKNFSREFWKYLDDPNSTTRRVVRKKAFNVWNNIGEDVLSANFTEGSLIVVTKRGSEMEIALKETAGSITVLNKINVQESLEGDSNSSENHRKFEEIWNKLIDTNGEYPSDYRPLTSSVAQMISARTGTSLPVVCFGLNKKIMPSDLSNGFVELSKKSMPKEVFEEGLVNSAIQDGVAERVGQENNFTFKVKRDKYQEWIARTEASKWRDSEAAPTEEAIAKESTENSK